MQKPLRSVAEVGALLRAVRIAAGLSQREAAALCGVSAPFLSDVENGKETLQLGRVLRVCDGLGVRVGLEAPVAIEAARTRRRRRRQERARAPGG
jgi:transcriptional regulator with XRE-family HTH domain